MAKNKVKGYKKGEEEIIADGMKEKQDSNMVREAAYAPRLGVKGARPAYTEESIRRAEPKAILRGGKEKPENHMTTFEKIGLIKEGISKNELENLKMKSGLDYDQLAKALSVTRVTLINKKNDERFSQSLSEKIVGLADLYSYGYEVFEDEQKFNRWILRPNQALGGQAPFEIIDTQYGREEVTHLIGRIAYGVYS